MNYKPLLLGCIALLPIFGCTDRAYDLSDGLNKEITLFQDEIYVPVGDVGPLTIQSLVGNLLSSILPMGQDGTITADSESEIYKVNVYDVAALNPDPSAPYHWEIGSKSGMPSGVGSALGFLGFKFTGQRVAVKFRNPLFAKLPVSATAKVVCRGKDYQESYSETKEIKGFTADYGSVPSTLCEFSLPDTVQDGVSAITLENLSVDLPADQIPNIFTKDQLYYIFSAQYKANVALGDNFSMEQILPLRNLDVPLGQFRLRKCRASFDLVSTLPMNVTLKKIRLLDADGKPVEDVVFSQDVLIAGGTPTQPAATPVQFQVEAVRGSIPDIHAVEVSFLLQSAPGLGSVPLSMQQGISLKSASVKISGGITLFGHDQ